MYSKERMIIGLIGMAFTMVLYLIIEYRKKYIENLIKEEEEELELINDRLLDYYRPKADKKYDIDFEDSDT